MASRTPSAFSRASADERRLHVLHDRALGDLHLQAAGVEPGFQEDALDLIDQIGLQELPARQVHARSTAVDVIQNCTCHWRSCSAAVRITHMPMGRISLVSSASGMNSSGQTSPRSGWYQRKRASKLRDPARSGATRSAGNGAATPSLHVAWRRSVSSLQAGHGLGVHRLVEDHMTRLAPGLGPVHRDVRVRAPPPPHVS